MLKDQNAQNIKTFTHDSLCSYIGIATMFFILCVLFCNYYYFLLNNMLWIPYNDSDILLKHLSLLHK